MDRIEAGKIEDACKLLLAGVQLELKGRRSRKNVRLFDLLAGLSIRYREGERFLPQLKGVLRTAADDEELEVGLKKQIEARLKKWLEPKSSWRVRWANQERAILWHHPLDMSSERQQRAVSLPASTT